MRLDELERDTLLGYLDLLSARSREDDLTGLTDPRDLVLELLVDSLAAAPHLPKAARVVDLGSGAGIPGIPLAVARPDLTFSLVESSHRKTAFLCEAVTRSGLSGRAQVSCSRAEVLGRERRASFGAAVARALAPLPVLLE
ncbi:MAG: 16S rRNA (guanine(527)-N(7))-methyltransferase RsmG, partial [Candidatus Eremiobacterota bacterium]